MPVDTVIEIISSAESLSVQISAWPLCNSKSGPEFLCFSCSSLQLSSNLPAGWGWWTDRHICPFPLLAVVTSLPYSQGCILAVWPILINTSLSHLQARCGTALRDMEGGSGVYQASVPSMSLVEVATAWALFPKHTNTHTQGHIYTYLCWSTKTHSSSKCTKMQTWTLPCAFYCLQADHDIPKIT